MSLSILEMAAELRAQAARTRSAIDDLRAQEQQGDDHGRPHWTTYSLLVGELEEVAGGAVRASWQAMQRIEGLVRDTVKPTT